MMTHFHVKNYKCLADIRLPLTPIHVLIGQNDSGKTSLLEALYAFFRSSEMQLSQAFPGHWEGRDLVFANATKPEIEFAAEWQPRDQQQDPRRPVGYGFRVEFPSGGGRICSRLEEWFANGGRHALPVHPDSWTSVGYRAHAGAEQRPDLEAIANLLRGAQMYRLYGRAMALPAAINPRRKFRMDPDGFGLPTLLDDLLGYAPEVFIGLREKFCAYFPQFTSIRIETEVGADREYRETGLHSMSQNTGKAIYFETRTGGTIRAQQASDGALLFLGFLALAHLPRPPRLLLIEEPEQGIYPKRLDEVMGLLKRLAQEVKEAALPQILLSTHSPHLLSAFRPEEVTLLSRQPDGSVRARPLREAPNIQERLGGGEFYLGELWYNLTEEELFHDAQPATNP